MSIVRSPQEHAANIGAMERGKGDDMEREKHSREMARKRGSWVAQGRSLTESQPCAMCPGPLSIWTFHEDSSDRGRLRLGQSPHVLARSF